MFALFITNDQNLLNFARGQPNIMSLDPMLPVNQAARTVFARMREFLNTAQYTNHGIFASAASVRQIIQEDNAKEKERISEGVRRSRRNK